MHCHLSFTFKSSTAWSTWFYVETSNLLKSIRIVHCALCKIIQAVVPLHLMKDYGLMHIHCAASSCASVCKNMSSQLNLGGRVSLWNCQFNSFLLYQGNSFPVAQYKTKEESTGPKVFCQKHILNIT